MGKPRKDFITDDLFLFAKAGMKQVIVINIIIDGGFSYEKTKIYFSSK